MASKFADAVVVRFGKGKPTEDPAMEPDADADAKAGAAEPEDDEADKGEEKPGAKGKLLLAAIRKGNGESVEELIKSICGY